ncbi:MAG: hypothetical protein M1820_008982 [Bogoriella megaspora]|nr:MAG: hypothetical protein M1820_008982 [Bogoriella megaspora]
MLGKSFFRSGTSDSSNSTPSNGGKLPRILSFLLRLSQLCLSLATITIYAPYLTRAHSAHVYYDTRWFYAVVVSSLTILTCLILIGIMSLNSFRSSVIPIHVRPLMIWDYLLALLWVVVTGIFGTMYGKEKPEGDKRIVQMKNAVWVDLALFLLFLGSAAWATIRVLKHRREERWGKSEV